MSIYRYAWYGPVAVILFMLAAALLSFGLLWLVDLLLRITRR